MKTAIIVAFLFTLVLCVYGQTEPTNQNSQGKQNNQLTECQNAFLQHLNDCFDENQLVFNNFLWVVSNGANGNAPEDADTLKTDMCAKEQPLIECSVAFMKTLLNSSTCTPGPNTAEDERPLISNQFQSIFTTFDEMCAHPCRHTLATELRGCYLDAELDPALFLSNATMKRGAVIGTNERDVNDFCIHKDALISCMKNKRDACPESPVILRAIGLDIESMEKGVRVLCSHKDVYLEGIDCFAEPTEAVIECQKTLNQETMDLMMTSQKDKYSTEQYFSHFCDIRIEHVSCDLRSWRQNTHTSCSSAVIGLRTELECGLLPDKCADSHRLEIDDVCHLDNFERDMRVFENSSGALTVNALSVLTLLAVGFSVKH